MGVLVIRIITQNIIGPSSQTFETIMMEIRAPHKFVFICQRKKKLLKKLLLVPPVKLG
jgi:hypothetical protein